jgi:MFS family permease
MSEPSARSGALAPLRRRRFRTVWLAEASAVMGEGMFFVAVAVLVIDLRGPGAEVGAVLAGASLLLALMLPLGGWLGDRFQAERLMLVTNLARAVLIAALAALVLAGDPPMAAIYALVAAMGAVDGLHFPVVFSFAPRAVPEEELPAANSLIQGTETVSDLIGPGVAAVAIAALGLGAAFVAVAACSALAALVLLRAAVGAAPHLPGAGSEAERPLAQFTAGLRVARAEPAVRWPLLLIAALSLVGLGPFLVGGAALAETRLGGASALPLLFSGYGVGTLVGLGAVARLGITRQRRTLVMITVTVMGAGLAGLGLVEAPGPALAVAAAIGVAESVLDVALTTWLQESAPDEVMARVMSLVVLAYVGTDPLSYALAGALLPLGITAVFAIAGGLTVLAGLLALGRPALRAAPR